MSQVKTVAPKVEKKNRPVPKPGRKMTLEEAMKMSHEKFGETFKKLAK